MIFVVLFSVVLFSVELVFLVLNVPIHADATTVLMQEPTDIANMASWFRYECPYVA